MKNKFFQLIENNNEADIQIYGDITSWPWLEGDTSSYTLSKLIEGLECEVINVYINSYGGEVAEGLAIYNQLKRHKARVKTVCDGFACSAASIVFMAGDERVMSTASLLMIHNAWTYASGNSKELRKLADDLDTITQASINAYMQEVNITEEELKQMLDDETWIAPQEALEKGFITTIVNEKDAEQVSQSVKKSLMKLVLNSKDDIEDNINQDEEKEFKCGSCGYIYKGEEPPKECPKCGNDAEQFTEITDEDEDNKTDEDNKSEDKQSKAESRRLGSFFNFISKGEENMILGKKNKYSEAIQKALISETEEEAQQAWNDFANAIVEQCKEDAAIYEQTGDKTILAQRGYRQLTSAEEQFYNKFIEASKMKNIQQAVTTLTSLTTNEAMPETIIEDVYRELIEEHPLLSKVNFQSVAYATKVIMNDHTKQNAVWGEIDATITKEITSAFKLIDITQNKLTAFAVIPMGLLDLGPVFLDAYIRTILKDAIATALEEAIVKGDGNKKPIGLMMKLTGAVDGVHAQKTAVSVTDFGIKSMGTLIAKLAKNEKGKNRQVSKLTLICNAIDYYTLVAPAVRVQNMSGAYVDNFAFPMEVVTSEAVPTGKAVMAMLDNYFVGVGFAKEGVIEFSDEYKFLEDQRTYKIKTYGAGRAIDENSALVLDISGLEEAIIPVKVKGTVESTVKGTVTTKAES